MDLLGALAYGELAAFERLAEDAKLAPTLADKAELAKMASAEFHHFERLRDRLAEIGEEPTGAMEPFVAAYDGFHKQTDPSDWLEGLVKAYVGDSIASDFYREVRRPPRHGHPRAGPRRARRHRARRFRRGEGARGDRRRPARGRAARPVGAAADGGGALAVPAGGGRPGRAVDHARGRGRGRLRPGRGGQDVLPDHRGAHQADGGAGSGGLTPSSGPDPTARA
ncbi:hypothetical protein SLI_5450 [Streptomyces lividans 1326]|uniref:Ferritin-like domain-containing protein n=1 Tax=Streptomyces lividans 1326 TaxID=1200984 RepID=A0A7U9HCX2_STRLI|nr:hypothetical protein SLI_5450 [Streptomyces lividans 1326]